MHMWESEKSIYLKERYIVSTCFNLIDLIKVDLHMMARVWQYKPLSTQRIFHQISPRPSFGRFASKPKCSVKKH